MTRKLKVLGLALVAALALSAVAASGAGAEGAELSVGIEPAIDGEQIGADTFTIGSIPVTCGTATYNGDASILESGAPEMRLTPSYETCHAMILIFGFKVTRTATVTLNGCTYVLGATKDTGGVSFSADLTVDCPAEKGIEIHVYSNSAHAHNSTVLCTYDVAHQALADDAVELTNTASHDLIAHIDAGLAVTNTIKNATCGNAESPESAYEGEDTLTATVDAEGSLGMTIS